MVSHSGKSQFWPVYFLSWKPVSNREPGNLRCLLSQTPVASVPTIPLWPIRQDGLASAEWYHTAGAPLLHMLYYMNWLTHDFWTRTGGWEFDRFHGAATSSPSHWQQVEEQAPKPVGWMLCFLLMTFVPAQKLCVNIYYIYAISIFLYEFCFLWFTNCVLLSGDNRLIPGCLWLMAFVLNNTLILGIWCSTIPHLPGCFCPWTFFQNIGFNMVPSDPFMSHLATQLGYSAGKFQALQLSVLATFGVMD